MLQLEILPWINIYNLVLLFFLLYFVTHAATFFIFFSLHFSCHFLYLTTACMIGGECVAEGASIEIYCRQAQIEDRFLI